jgi:hypothetical protein
MRIGARTPTARRRARRLRTVRPSSRHFNAQGNQKIQSLTPQGLLTPQGPQPFDTFRTEHFCATWQPLLTFNNGNEPQQP